MRVVPPLQTYFLNKQSKMVNSKLRFAFVSREMRVYDAKCRRSYRSRRVSISFNRRRDLRRGISARISNPDNFQMRFGRCRDRTVMNLGAGQRAIKRDLRYHPHCRHAYDGIDKPW